MACNCIGGNPCPCRGGPWPVGRVQFAPQWAVPSAVFFGTYKCQRCAKDYTVNDQWAACTPDFCHDCYGYLKAQYATIPVDSGGHDVPQ